MTDKMADLAEEGFNYICVSGGFVKLFVLLKNSSPLRSRKPEAEAKNWMMSKAGPRLVVLKDLNGEISWCAN